MSGALRRLVRAAQRLLPAGRHGVTVLAYHLVEAGTGSPVDLPRSVFRRQMDELAATAAVLSLTDAADRLQRDDLPLRPAVVLTFDDAYRNFADVVWPLLAERSLPATLYVPVGFLDGTIPPPITGTDLPPMEWHQLRNLAAGGALTVGSHGWNHRDTRRLDDAGEARELADSRAVLEDRLGLGVEAFCYPRGLWSRGAEDRVRRHYRWATIGGGGQATPRRFRPLRLQRVSLRRDMLLPLAPVLAAPVWWEERIADLGRRALR